MKSNQRATIETLLERNTSQREIARITGIDRKTVRSYHQRWLEQLQSNSPGVATSSFITDGATIDVWTISKSVITGTTVTTRHNLKYLSFLFLRNSLFDFFWRVASTL